MCCADSVCYRYVVCRLSSVYLLCRISIMIMEAVNHFRQASRSSQPGIMILGQNTCHDFRQGRRRPRSPLLRAGPRAELDALPERHELGWVCCADSGCCLSTVYLFCRICIMSMMMNYEIMTMEAANHLRILMPLASLSSVALAR